MLEDVIAFRRRLHAHPELSGMEMRTHDAIAAYLRPLHPTCLYEKVGGYGLIAAFGGTDKDALVFRADTDALPVQELTPLSYASQWEGVAHKCGHDGHAAILLRLAEKLSARLQAGEGFPFTALLLFQAAEETGEGSRRVLASGVLDAYRIRGVYGLHNLPGFPVGRLVFRYGTFAAASTGVALHLQGRQTHAAFPEKGINPGLAVAQIIQRAAAMNTSPEKTDGSFRQVTLIQVRLGKEAFGTSAGDADLLFTLRAYTNKGMEALQTEFLAMAAAEAKRYKLSLTTDWKEPFHATENHAEAVDRLVHIAEKAGMAYGSAACPFRWSEDFADYLMRYPGAFFGIGSGERQPELHHPDFDFPDALVEPAACFWERLFLSEQ